MIQKYLRVIIVMIALIGIAVLAKNQVAWAGPATETKQVNDLGQTQFSISLNKPNPGSVNPPPSSFRGCENDLHSVAGVFTVEIKDLKPGYCVEVELSDPAYVGRIPEDAGKTLADMGIFRIYFHGDLVYELPMADGSIQTCFAIPPKKQALIYFYDFFGERFEKRTSQPLWEKIDNTIDQNVACAFTQKSGMYALIGK